MTPHRGTPSPRPLGRPWMIASGGLLALAMLTGCQVADTDAPESAAPTPSNAASSPTTAETSPVDDSGDDPVFAALEAVLGAYPGAVIVAVDREDDDSRHDVEAVVGDRVLELEVLADGTVREDDEEDGDDGDEDIRRAGAATVTAEEAARAALEGRDGQSVDDMELDDEDDTLVWAVDLDHKDGGDGDEVLVDAATGEVTRDG